MPSIRGLGPGRVHVRFPEILSTSVSVRSSMKSSIAFFCAVLSLGSAVIDPARSESLRATAFVAPARCAAAAQSVRDWGWIDRADSRAPLSSIVSAVNRRLRTNAGRLPAADIARLRTSSSADDACIRALSVEILRTQEGTAVPLPRRRLAITASRKSVTGWLEKQSPTSEAISP
jgi:hypothetical protein